MTPTKHYTKSNDNDTNKKRPARLSLGGAAKRARLSPAQFTPAHISPPHSGRDYPASKDFPYSNERNGTSPMGLKPVFPTFQFSPRKKPSDVSDPSVSGADDEDIISDYHLPEKAWRSNMADCEGIVQRCYGNISGAISYIQSFPDELADIVFVDGEVKANDLLFLQLQERQKTCSGRDELCNSVLNDEWASHPTWASEDSGFIAHKKNLHEEGLHRIEEERHDYDAAAPSSCSSRLPSLCAACLSRSSSHSSFLLALADRARPFTSVSS
jgi:hypothetical protein